MEEFIYKYDELYNPLLQALRELGGSGRVNEIEGQVARILQLDDKQIDDIHRGNRTKLSYRLAWARNYLKNFGLLENTSRGVWSLTVNGYKTETIDRLEVNRNVKAIDYSSSTDNDDLESNEDEVDSFGVWQDKLKGILLDMTPKAFERLCQQVLRSLGFTSVEVTGRSSDGGIDGKGVIVLGSVLSFHVVFQCKRYTGSVGAPVIRDFRGAMMGRADKGVVITTGLFTAEAKKEAQRDGAPPIDLVDGNSFAEILKDLQLGISVEMVEKVNIDSSWFDRFSSSN